MIVNYKNKLKEDNKIKKCLKSNIYKKCNIYEFIRNQY